MGVNFIAHDYNRYSNCSPFTSKHAPSLFMKLSRISAITTEALFTRESINEFKTHIKNWNGADCVCRLCRVFVPQFGFL